MEEPMSDIDTEYVKGMFHTGQYELNEDILDGEFDAWLASHNAAVEQAVRIAIARDIERLTPDGRRSQAFCAGMDRAARIAEGDNR